MRDLIIGAAIGAMAALGIIYLFKKLSAPQLGQVGPVAENLEEVSWTDWRDRERKITIHRRVG